jgi:hypothetical protein
LPGGKRLLNPTFTKTSTQFMATYSIADHNLELSDSYETLHVKNLSGTEVASYTLPAPGTGNQPCSGSSVCKLSADSTNFIITIESCSFCDQSRGYGFDPDNSDVGFTNKTTLGGHAIIDLRDMKPVTLDVLAHFATCPIGLQYNSGSLWKLAICYASGSTCIEINP